MEKIFAVINLGSSNITGMLATRLPNGKINPIAYCQRNSRNSIVHGYIHNITEASAIIDSIVDELNQSLQSAEIKKVYVGLDCQSMRSHLHKAKLSFGSEGVILDHQHIQELYNEALGVTFPQQSTLQIATPSYLIDGKREYNPKGVRCHTLEASYQIITVREDIKRNIYEVFESKLGLTIEEILISPIAEAAVSLTREEMSLGCAYINIGAGTTSISLYKGRLLNALHVLPLGGHNVTKDLTHLRLLEQDAEYIKLKYGSMDTEVKKQETITATSTTGTGDKILSRFDINNYINARMNELTENIKSILSEVIHNTQINYLVFSGGGARIKGYLQSLNYDSARLAYARYDILNDPTQDNLLIDYQSALGLVHSATNNCVETTVQPLEEVFGNEPQEEIHVSELHSSSTDNSIDEEEPSRYIFQDLNNDEEINDPESDEDDNDNRDDEDESTLSQVKRWVKNKLIGPSK